MAVALFRRPGAVTALAAAVALVSALVVALAGFGTRWGWWDFRTGFALMRWGAWGGIAGPLPAVGAAIWAAMRGRGAVVAIALAGALAGAAAFGVLWAMRARAQDLPPSHDITTDTGNPPRFVAVLPLRQGAANPADHGGPELAAQQQRGYPDLRSFVTGAAPAATFDVALAAVRAMGWEVVATVPAEGRIEAVAATPWFGFKDDVVIRVAPAGTGSRLDVRSVSRVGRSDLGTNARRIRAFLSEVSARLPR